MKNETTSKDTSKLKCKNAMVEIKQKFLEIVNTTQDIYCTRPNRDRIYKKNISITLKTLHNIGY